MNSDFRYLYFSVLDYTNSPITSGYTLPITPFTFIPKFDAGDNMVVSNTQIIWDFGDGTTSRDLTASHYYKIPGTYSVKCYFYGTSGIGYESSFTQNILVKDFISDTLVLSSKDNPIIRASRYENPFLISRFNSWQTYNSLSSEGATILLEVSGNSSPLLDVETYFQDKYSHLKASARFVTIDFNEALSSYDPVPVNTIKTINNKDIYVRLDNNNNIVYAKKEDLGSVLAGTSGQRLVYFTDDIVKTPDNKTIKPVNINISFDYNNFYDVDNVKYNIKDSYSVLNGTIQANFTPSIYYVEELNCMSFSTNGIDTEGNFNINTFEIGKNKFVGQQIPFVAKSKDFKGFTSKTWKKFALKNESETLVDNSIKFYLKDSKTNSIIPSAFDIYEDYGEFENYEKLGFFKGYIVPKISATDVRICCDVKTSGETFIPTNTKYLFVTSPQSVSAMRVELLHDYASNIFDPIGSTKTILDTVNLSGMYAGIVIPKYVDRNITYAFWAVDSDQDLVSKIDFETNITTKINLPSGTSPSFLAADSVGDIWVTLYDSLSVCKLSSNGDILFYTTPSATNVDYNSNSFYIPNSGAAGSNSIMPAIVDTDMNDNAWVIYNFTLSSFACKYDQNGNLLNTYDIPTDYIAYDLICSRENISWILLKNKNSHLNDGLLKINQTTNTQSFIQIDHKVWSFANDINENLWFIANESDILKMPFGDDNVYFVKTLTSSSNNIIVDSNFNGIATTTQGDLLIFDYADKNIKIFNIRQLDNNSNTATPVIFDLSDISAPAGSYQNFINSKGDCTGLKYTQKYLYSTPMFDQQGCCSNIFNIYAPDSRNIAKINENFDMSAQMKNFALQESLRDSNILFDDFIKQSIGSREEDPTSLGKKIYEKISNFVDNNAFIDTCNVDKLNSLHKMLNENLYIFNTNNFPSNISRLLDLFSIKLSKLKGSRNAFNENFDTKGYNGNTDIRYGRNLGNELDFFTTILTGGIDGHIVAHERFSNSYTLCNTNVLTANYIDSINKTYSLSSYSPTWGWSLVLPQIYNQEDIIKYYTFYTHISTTSNEQLEGIINWSDKFTTVSESVSSYDDWWSQAENIITKELMLGLELLSSNT
jgi:hypothetical protein